MDEARYDLVFYGQIAPGFDFDQVKGQFAAAFSLGEEQAEQILKSRRVVLKRNLDHPAAVRFQAVLKKAGILVSVEAAPSLPAPSAPAFPQVPVGSHKPQPAPIEKAVASPAGPKRIPFEFKGSGSEYFRIWLVNILLSIVTLGIYSPWAKVRRKQYIYGSIRLNGAGFQYLADPVKILKGRLLVVGFFVVSGIASDLVPILNPILGLLFAVAFPWMIIRSLAFNARNSAIRNIRFGFDATYAEAAKVYLLWPILAAFTLGIIFPYVYFRQRKFMVENTRYGTTPLSFSATSRDYYGVFFSTTLPILGGLVISVLLAYFFVPLGILAGLALYLVVSAWISVKSGNLLYNASRLARHGFESKMGIKDYTVLVLENTVATALTLGLFHPWAQMRTLRYRMEHLALIPGGDLDSFVAAEQKEVSAVGDEVSDFLDFEFGL